MFDKGQKQSSTLSCDSSYSRSGQNTLIFKPHQEKTNDAYAKTKTQISFAGNREADQHLCFCYTDSTFPLLYTPGIYADGYIVFALPFVRLYVRSLVRFFVRNSGTFVEFMSKFWLKFL